MPPPSVKNYNRYVGAVVVLLQSVNHCCHLPIISFLLFILQPITSAILLTTTAMTTLFVLIGWEATPAGVNRVTRATVLSVKVCPHFNSIFDH